MYVIRYFLQIGEIGFNQNLLYQGLIFLLRQPMPAQMASNLSR